PVAHRGGAPGERLSRVSEADRDGKLHGRHGPSRRGLQAAQGPTGEKLSAAPPGGRICPGGHRACEAAELPACKKGVLKLQEPNLGDVARKIGRASWRESVYRGGVAG